MKYVFLFCGTTEDQQVWDSMPEDERAQAYARVGEWFETNRDVFRGGNQLQSPSTATTVRRGENGTPTVTDGPFIEGNEVIGGYAEIEVANLDEALALAKTWPAGPVEIRPVVER